VEYGIKCCASLAKRAVERGHHVQLYSIGAKVDHVAPGGGTTHLLTLLDRLAFLKPEGDSAFAVVVRDLLRDIPRGSTCVAIQGATTVRMDAIAEIVSLMIDRQILPVIVLVDDRAFIKIWQDQEMAHSKAPPLDQLERELTLLGARVHVIRRARSMEQALLQGLEREAAGR
jgi:uncharacterized protein (DUF58 family)